MIHNLQLQHHLLNPACECFLCEPGQRVHDGAIFDGQSTAQLNSNLTETDLPPLLVAAIRDVYLPAGLQLTEAPQREAESADYGAVRLGLNGQRVVFRIAKITPIKIGQFVTLWKRPCVGTPVPLDGNDGIAFVVISVSDAGHHGQFIFSREILLAKGVMSIGGVGGKCAMRVYPPWSQPVAKQAIKTQQWQARYFVALEHITEGQQIRTLFMNP